MFADRVEDNDEQNLRDNKVTSKYLIAFSILIFYDDSKCSYLCALKLYLIGLTLLQLVR